MGSPEGVVTKITATVLSDGRGCFYGITSGLCTKNVFLRQRQFAMAEQPSFCKRLARALVAGKIRNQRTFLLRNHVEPAAVMMREMKKMGAAAEEPR